MTIWTSPQAFRREIREGRFTQQTGGQCPGFTQGNVAILPADYAAEFLNFARLNPKSCPVIGVTQPGSTRVPELGDVDLMSDCSAYCVFRDGELVGEAANLRELWREDLVGFVIGCSLSFEEALSEAGVPLRHQEQGTMVPVYATQIPNQPSGRFGGTMVVSMRPMKAADAIRAIQITSRFPSVHGAPVHIGDPSLIGIRDLARPEYGGSAEVRAGELPVFWACGVTPQQAIRSARPPLAITHKTGHMVMTDIRNSHLAVI
ncbi:putative hydro-lyase [Variovorax sp. CY25R-8]|uniref:putative hydro-lyase n=1 Tax=Variovorax sp. CY25R-8 TaxID=2855501 RepID=UPI0021BB9524|nr:putative hydro-lyase [Variovorax sp. CY25R-8]MCT8179223.1 putative hydro-lyase [Variovorax sp. CY25R-8]